MLVPLLPGREWMWHGVARGNREFTNAVIRILRTGAPWRDLPGDDGSCPCGWRIGGNEAIGITKGGETRKYIWPCAHGLPFRVIITADHVADCTQAAALTSGIPAQCLLADKGYDTNAIAESAQTGGI